MVIIQMGKQKGKLSPFFYGETGIEFEIGQVRGSQVVELNTFTTLLLYEIESLRGK